MTEDLSFLPKGETKNGKKTLSCNSVTNLMNSFKCYAETGMCFSNIPPGNFRGPPRCGEGVCFWQTPLYPISLIS